jgi:hypothetical protein
MEFTQEDVDKTEFRYDKDFLNRIEFIYEIGLHPYNIERLLSKVLCGDIDIKLFEIVWKYNKKILTEYIEKILFTTQLPIIELLYKHITNETISEIYNKCILYKNENKLDKVY